RRAPCERAALRRGAHAGRGGGRLMWGGGGHWHGQVAGLPFAGVPAELRPDVERLVASEPKRETPPVEFSYRTLDRRRLTLRGLLARQKKLILVAVAMLVLETLSLQAGPVLAQVGIDHG